MALCPQFSPASSHPRCSNKQQWRALSPLLRARPCLLSLPWLRRARSSQIQTANAWPEVNARSWTAPAVELLETGPTPELSQVFRLTPLCLQCQPLGLAKLLAHVQCHVRIGSFHLAS